jgi:AmmeMemoRadiSam system protein A
VAHPLVELAKSAVSSYVKEKNIIKAPDVLAEEMKGRAGTFVSIHSFNGDLRGCIGTFAPTRNNIAEEVIYNAISAATQDPRFPPVGPDELSGLDISVDVLSQPEPVSGLAELNAKEYGVIVKAGNKRGLLLPDLEGVASPEQQVSICRRKGGIGEKEPVELFRFRVKRYH